MNIFRLVLLFFLGYFLIRLFKNAFGTKTSKSSSNRSAGERRKEGDVSIDTRQPGNKKRIDKDDGDYVDFEEL